MKKLSILLLIFSATAMAQQTTTIYLIRHAEKADNSANPDLSEAGKARAQRWADYFKDKNVRVLYTTPYLRTLNTIMPTGSLYNITIGSETTTQFINYNPVNLSLKAVADKHAGENILIAGHSNTIPKHINDLLGKQVYADIPENEYNHLYIIKFTGDKITHELVKM